jgi:hypothetical protein
VNIIYDGEKIHSVNRLALLIVRMMVRNSLYKNKKLQPKEAAMLFASKVA